MRKIKNIVAIATVAVMAFSMAGCKMIEKTPAAIQKTVLAKVGNEKITMADVNSELKSDIDYLIQTYGKDYENSMDDTMKEKLKSARKSVLEQLVNDKVLITKGTELGYVLSGDELNAAIEKERQNFVEAYGGEDKLQEAIKYYGMDDDKFNKFLENLVKTNEVTEAITKDVTVTDEDVDKDIEATQKKNARLITVDDRAIENGDIAVIDFEGFVDDVAFEGGKGEDYELEIGSGTFIPGFEEQLVGAETDADVDVKVTFPEEYHAENLAGKDAVFKVKVKEIKKRELPELDDDFASEVSEFDTMDEFRADVRKKLEEAAENKAKVETENAVIDKVIENAEFDLPDAMVETQIDNSVRDFAQRLSYQGMNLDMYMQYTGMTMDALRAQFAEQAKKQLSGSLVLEAIQKAEGIEAGPEEVELELVDMSKKYNMELDKLKELLGDAEKESIKKDLEIQKTITMIVNNAQVK